jgi:hypothetical protein
MVPVLGNGGRTAGAVANRVARVGHSAQGHAIVEGERRHARPLECQDKSGALGGLESLADSIRTRTPFSDEFIENSSLRPMLQLGSASCAWGAGTKENRCAA